MLICDEQTFLINIHYTATEFDRSVSMTCFKEFLNIKQNKPFSSYLHLLLLLFTTEASNEGSQTARRISVSKTTAPGKGLKVMCLKGDAYMHACACICMHTYDQVHWWSKYGKFASKRENKYWL